MATWHGRGSGFDFHSTVERIPNIDASSGQNPDSSLNPSRLPQTGRGQTLPVHSPRVPVSDHPNSPAICVQQMQVGREESGLADGFERLQSQNDKTQGRRSSADKLV
eukprot:575926-Rhodomonas_salina.1